MMNSDAPEDLDEALFYVIGILLGSLQTAKMDLPYRRATIGFLLDHMDERNEESKQLTDVLRTMLKEPQDDA